LIRSTHLKLLHLQNKLGNFTDKSIAREFFSDYQVVMDLHYRYLNGSLSM